MPRWVFWMALTLLSWGVWAVLSRLIPASISPAQGQAMSTVGLVPIILALGAMRGGGVPGGNRRRGIWLAFGSGVISSVGNIAYYAALADAKAATIAPLAALYPAVTILLAVPVLKERITRVQWLGMGCSLAAIYLFNPVGEQRGLSPAVLLAIVALVLWGVTSLLQKMSTDHISGAESALWFLVAFVPVAGLLLAYDPLPSGISTKTWGIAAAIGFALAFGNLTVLLAFASGGTASLITPLSGLYYMVSIPLAIFWLGEQIDQRESIGIALALAAVLMLSYTPTPTPEAAPLRRE